MQILDAVALMALTENQFYRRSYRFLYMLLKGQHCLTLLALKTAD